MVWMKCSNDIDTTTTNSSSSSSSSSSSRSSTQNRNRNLNRNDRLDPKSTPRSLLRDRLLEQPHRHHRPFVVMSVSGGVTTSSTTTTTTQSTSNETQNPTMVVDSAPGGRCSPSSSLVLPKIDESDDSDDVDNIRHHHRRHNSNKNDSNNGNDNSGHSSSSPYSIMRVSFSSSRVPPLLSDTSDHSSVGSFQDFSSAHSSSNSSSSSSSSSSCSLEDDFHNNDYSFGSSTTTSTMLIGSPNSSWQQQQQQQHYHPNTDLASPSEASSSSSSSSSRRRPNSSRRRHSEPLPQKQQQQQKLYPHCNRRSFYSSASSSPSTVTRSTFSSPKIVVPPNFNKSMCRLPSSRIGNRTSPAAATTTVPAIKISAPTMHRQTSSPISTSTSTSSLLSSSSSMPRLSYMQSPFSRKAPVRSSTNYSKTRSATTTKEQHIISSSSSSRMMMTRRQCMIHFLSSVVMLQLLLLFAIATLVVWSRSEAALATNTLLHLQEAESFGLLKLHRLEDHSMHVHELMRDRLLRTTKTTNNNNNNSNGNDDDDDGDDDDLLSADNNSNEESRLLDTDTDTDIDPLLTQHQQLAAMSSELRRHAAVTTLQKTIQEAASEEIVEAYGEGPVKVIIELDFGGGGDDDNDNDKGSSKASNRRNTPQQQQRQRAGTGTLHPRDMMTKGTYLSIVLWPDAPHAAWTWLEQIARNVWDGAALEWDSSSTLLQFRPTTKDDDDTNDNENRGSGHHLEFVEHHPNQEKSNPDMHHGAWTIGMRETFEGGSATSSSNANANANNRKTRLEMFINLADNQEERKHETCLGKILDGFDALQRLLEATRLTEDGDAFTNVTVKTVTAMHMTHQELEQIYR